jgi:hypothetical protein
VAVHRDWPLAGVFRDGDGGIPAGFYFVIPIHKKYSFAARKRDRAILEGQGEGPVEVA